MRIIPLTCGAIAIVDAQDHEAVLGRPWHFAPARLGKTGYAFSKDGNQTIWLHRFVSARMGFPIELQVDHINRHGLDCQRQNLRPATALQNQGNIAVRRDNQSGFKGVSLNRRARKWRAQIRINGIKTFLGDFEDARKAADAYDEAAKKQFGEFAFLNHQPTEGR